MPLIRHCMAQNVLSRQVPLERHCSGTIRDHTAPLEQHYLGIFANTRTVETTPPRNASETTTTFPLATTLPQKFPAATQSFELSQPFATTKPDVCTEYHTPNRRLGHRLFSIFYSIAIIAHITDRNAFVWCNFHVTPTQLVRWQWR